MKPLAVLLATLSISAALPAAAGDVLPSVAERFQKETAETPDFQKHVVPLLGRLGCNGRACHGSFKGQGGFQLSLFGYDFENDHKQIAGEEAGRVFVDDPALSLLLMKPTLEEEHGGGKRMDVDSWQYRLLRRWIDAGADWQSDRPLKLKQLVVSPSELIFDREGVETPLEAVAVWSDGTREVVTDLCRFQSNNPTVAEINDDGVVTSGQPGDTHVVVFYDGGVVPIPVIRPVSDKVGPNYPALATRTPIDELVVTKLKKLGIVPSEVCSDAEFLRRVSLDLTGTLPPAWEVAAFVKDSSSDKRSRKVEELLESPAYSAWWTTRLCDWTGNNPDFANIEIGRNQVAEDWYAWIEKRVAENVSYDEIVAGIVLSQSREEGESFADLCETMTAIYSREGDDEFADRSTMSHYWVRTNFRKAEDRAIGFAYSFLGIRIQCAQCHKHPFDQWTQDDFKNFESFFTRVEYGIARDSKEEYDAMVEDLADGEKGGQLRRTLGKMLLEGKTVPFREVYVTAPRNGDRGRRGKGNAGRNRRNAPAAAGRVLGGETIDLNEYEDPRQPLMTWLRSPENPYFAKAFVNRVWQNYFGVGIVNPPDDLSLANPPSNEPLLDYLAEGFIASGFDMHWLHREIIASDTYQRSWKPNETNRQDETNFSRAVPRRLPAEAAYDAIALATASDEQVKKLLGDPSLRAIGVPGSGNRYRARIGREDASFALTVFGRSVRESNCDCDRSAEASLLQTVYLRNDGDILDALDGGRDTWVGSVTGADDDKPRSRERRDEDEGNAADRVNKLKQRITEAAREASRLRRQGKGQQAKQVVARVADLRKRLAQAERAAARQPQSDDRPADKPSDTDGNLPQNPAEIVEQAYLRTLTRYPTPDEIQDAVAYMQASDSPRQGVGDLLWALINTKEFIVNH